jgi:hypothetical protein
MVFPEWSGATRLNRLSSAPPPPAISVTTCFPSQDFRAPITVADRGMAPTFGGYSRGRRLVLPGISCRRCRELPLGFEPVVPVGAYGLAPRQPELVGANRDLLGGGTPVLSPLGEGRRDATLLDRCGSVSRAAVAGVVSVLLVGEGAWVARFLPDWLLGSTLCGSVSRAAGAGGVSVLLVGEGAWVGRFLPDWFLDMLDPSLGGRPERASGSGSDFPAGPASRSPGQGDGPPGCR